MSNQIEFNTKAIELTHDELECIAGGNQELISAFERQQHQTKEAARKVSKAEGEAAKKGGAGKAGNAFKELLQ